MRTIGLAAALASIAMFGVQGTASAYTGIARYATTGALDTTFHRSGREVVGAYFDGATSVLVSGGKVYAGGAFLTSSGGYQLIVGRFNGDGSIDTSYGIGGVTTTVYAEAQSSNREGVAGLAMDGSGRIVALCASDTGDGSGSEFLVRFNTNGSVDTTFGTNGIATPWVPTISAVPVGIRVSPDGSIVVADYMPTIEGPEANVIRFSSAGARLWGEQVVFERTGDTMGGLAVDSSNRIILTGRSGKGNQGVIRLLPDGRYDQSFGVNGRVILNWGLEVPGTGVAVDGSQRIVVVANRMSGNTSAEFRVARLSSAGVIESGSIDYTFAGTTGSPSDRWSIQVASDGKYVVGSTTKVSGKYRFMVTRLLATTLAWDPLFGTVGTVTTAFPETANAKGMGLALDSSDRPVMIGTLF